MKILKVYNNTDSNPKTVVLESNVKDLKKKSKKSPVLKLLMNHLKQLYELTYDDKIEYNKRLKKLKKLKRLEKEISSINISKRKQIKLKMINKLKENFEKQKQIINQLIEYQMNSQKKELLSSNEDELQKYYGI